jgi:hypothetical protein
MQDLWEAKETIRKYNKITLEELCDLYFKETGTVFSKDSIYRVKFTGLTSVDCLELLIGGFTGE